MGMGTCERGTRGTEVWEKRNKGKGDVGKEGQGDERYGNTGMGDIGNNG